jgi:hypothetical protein
MAESHWTDGRRAVIEDARQNGAFLRTTWHAESGVFVISHWNEGVCVAATRIPVEAVQDLIAVLVSGLAQSATAPAIKSA